MKQKNEKFSDLPKIISLIFALIILACAVALFEKSHIISVVMIVCSVVLIMEKLLHRLARTKKMKEYISDAAQDEEELQNNEALFKSINPITGIRVDGTVAWYNSAFKEVFGNVDDKKIGEIIPQIKVRDIYNKGGNSPIIVQIENDTYNIRVSVKRRTSPDHAAIMLYMEKITELVEVKKELYNAQNVVAHIVIDNYEEALADVEDEERFETIALLDKNVIGWAKDAGCLVKKMDKNKFLCVFTRKELEVFVENKFDLLQNLKSFNPDAKTPPTASIGIGVGGDTFDENDISAKKALEMALGRGGDQAVVRENGNFSYYGGNSKETEKRTKVKARIMARNLRELMQEADNVLIMGHKNSDADAIGAAIGIAGMAGFIKKDARVLLITNDGTVQLLLKKIEANKYHEGMLIGKSGLKEYITPKTLLVVCDTHVPEYTEMPELIDTIKRKVVIDHHRRSESFISGADLVFHEPFASSTSEMVAEIMQYFDPRFSVSTVDAEMLYAGIAVDTKNFTFKTGVRTFEAAAYLRSAGVDTMHVKKLLRESIDDYKLKASIVTEAELYSDNIAISMYQGIVPHLVIAVAADEMLEITDIKASFVIAKNNDGNIIVSGRSLGEFNVQVVLEKLGGGGHMMSAGAQLQGKTVEEVGEMLKAAIDEVL